MMRAHLFDTMTTLTCPTWLKLEGPEFKLALNKILQTISRRRSSNYFWFLEFTKKGMPHVHILHTNPMDGSYGKKTRVKKGHIYRTPSLHFGGLWAGYFVHSTDPNPNSRILVDNRLEVMAKTSGRVEPLKHAKKSALYLMKEFSGGGGKAYQKTAPVGFNAGRFWGFGGPYEPKPKNTVLLWADDVHAASQFRTKDGNFSYIRTRWNDIQDLSEAMDFEAKMKREREKSAAL